VGREAWDTVRGVGKVRIEIRLNAGIDRAQSRACELVLKVIVAQERFGELKKLRVRCGVADGRAESGELQVDVAVEAGRMRRTGSPRLRGEAGATEVRAGEGSG